MSKISTQFVGTTFIHIYRAVEEPSLQAHVQVSHFKFFTSQPQGRGMMVWQPDHRTGTITLATGKTYSCHREDLGSEQDKQDSEDVLLKGKES